MNFVTTQGTVQSQLVIGLEDFNKAMQNFKEEMLGELQSRMAQAEGDSRHQELMTAKAVAGIGGAAQQVEVGNGRERAGQLVL